MRLPKFLQTCFPSYKLQSVNPKKNKRLIITEVLNKGDDKALKWLTKKYSHRQIRGVVSKPTRGMWLNSVLKYWVKIFNINMGKHAFNKAIIRL